MFDQILAGKRQTGKSTWLIEQAVRQTWNRERAAVITVGPSSAMTSDLCQRVIQRLNRPTVHVYGHEGLSSTTRGYPGYWHHVVILVDEIQLHSEEVEDKIKQIKDDLTPAIDSTTKFYIYGTNNIGEEV